MEIRGTLDSPGMTEATLKLPADTLDFLREEARKRGVSTADMVRISIGTQKYLTRQIEQGGKVQVKNRKGTFDLKV
jgi:hypothetical protein